MCYPKIIVYLFLLINLQIFKMIARGEGNIDRFYLYAGLRNEYITFITAFSNLYILNKRDNVLYVYIYMAWKWYFNFLCLLLFL